MNLDFFKNFFAPKEADPAAVRKKQMKSKNIKINIKFVIIFFTLIVILLCLVSSIVITKEKDKKNDIVSNNTDDSTNAAVVNEFNESNFTSCNILLGFTESANENLKLLSVLNIDAQSGKMKISFIPETIQYKVNNYNGSMKDHLQNGGITELLWAVGEYTGQSIEKYICCDEDQFLSIMKYLGEIEIFVDEDINTDYNGISFIIEEGTHNFTADLMLKYFVYLCNNSQTHKEEIVGLFFRFIKMLIADESADAVKDTYNKIVNYIQTDISAMDISTYLNDIIKLKDFVNFENIIIE